MTEEALAFKTSVGLLGRWPEPPKFWSFSSLREAKACPRRYALSRATYSEIWDKRGYPDRVGDRISVHRRRLREFFH